MGHFSLLIDGNLYRNAPLSDGVREIPKINFVLEITHEERNTENMTRGRRRYISQSREDFEL